MPTCILHVGMPKTGTSSIQDSLCLGLEDPRFRYLAFESSNAVDYLEPLFSDDPAQHWAHRRRGYDDAAIVRLRGRFERRLRAALREARVAGATPIVSAERCWNASPAFLGRFRDFMADEGFEVRAIAYLRPFRTWYASVAQQMLKFGQRTVDFARVGQEARERASHEFLHRLADLERIFGAGNLTLRLFARDALAGGCAVRDFCTTLGIDLDPAAVVRTNDSLCADAVRMLHAFGRHGDGAAQLSLWRNHLLVARLQGLAGEPFRLHSSVFAPLADELAREERGILGRYGIDLREDASAGDDDRSCVRSEPDMLRFSRASLDWLAQAAGRTPIAGCEGEDVARQVAAQVGALAARPDLKLRLEFLRYRLRIKLRLRRHGR